MTWPLVYQATNLVNGKRYIGVTRRRLCSRKAKHFNEALCGKRGCRKFHAAIRKYGRDVFEWSVLIRVATYEQALKEEIRLIAELKPEYNITLGGEGTVGIVRSRETIEKHRASRAGWRPTAEQRARQSAAMMGRKFSDETRRKLAEAMKRRMATPEGKEMARATQRGRRGWKHSAETRAKMRATRAGRPRKNGVMSLEISP